MPFRDGAIDISFHQGLLEHFRDPLPLLAENARITRSGGRVLVDVPQTFHLYTVMKKLLILVNRWFAGWETQFTVPQLERLVRESGLDFTIFRPSTISASSSSFLRSTRDLVSP